MWRVTLVFAAMSLLCGALSSWVPAVGADPLIITVARNGSDYTACLEGKIACKTFDYAASVNGNGSDVTMIITYPQQMVGGEYSIGNYVRNLKLIGQVQNGYTFTCLDSFSIVPDSESMGYPKQLWLENVQILGKGALSIQEMDSVSLTGFIGQGLSLSYVKTVHVEDSTFIYDGDLRPNYKSIIYFKSATDLTSFTIKNSSLVHKEEKGRPLVVDFWFSDGDVSILIENTNFTLTRPPHHNQLAPMLLNVLSLSKITSVNFTISKCNFFNYNSTALEVDMLDKITVKDNIYLNILDSKFRVPPQSYGINRVEVFQGLGTQTNVHTRLDGNTFIPND
jgi:hypothetical protein